MTKQQAFITIVVPVYNRAMLVMRTLESIERQECKEFELILVDNNSTDNSLQVLEEWAAQPHEFSVRVLSESTPGPSAARNKGLCATTTPWILYFDSDDEMLPAHIKRIKETISTNPDVDLIGWNVEHNGLNGEKTIRSFYTTDLLYHNIFHGSLSTQRYCVNTSLLNDIGGWGNDVYSWDDIEMGNRLLIQKKPKVAFAGKTITVTMHATEKSITGTAFHHKYTNFDHSIDCIAEALPAEKRHWAELKRAILAADCTREGATEIGRKLMAKVSTNCQSKSHKMLCRIAYKYRCMGGRGIARILRPLL